MCVLNQRKFAEQDERTVRYLCPERIVRQTGEVRQAENLLTEKPLQIALSEEKLTVLVNRDGDSSHASVLLDFGVEFHGGIQLTTHFIARAATVQVRLCFGESVSEAMSRLGKKGACNDHSTRDMVAEIPALSAMKFGQTGYRFLKIELLTPDAEWELKGAAGVFVFRDLPYLGSFSCNDERLNRIYDVAAYTCHLNMQSLLWDGIKRDRLVWVGDMHPEMLTIRTVFGCQPILEKSLAFARAEAPLPGWMNGMPAYSLWWLMIVYDWYLYTGDSRFLNDNRDYVLGLIRQIAGYIGEDGSHSLPDYFFDWPTRGTDGARAGVHALLILAMRAGKKIAALYDEPQAAALCCGREKALSRVMPADGGYKQAAAMLLLAGMGDLPQTVRRLTEGGAKGMSTFTSYYVLTAVAMGGCMEQALDMLREYYGGMLSMGATTFWEDFDVQWLDNASPIDAPVREGAQDIHGDYGDYCYKGFRHSLCHGWSSGPVPFLAEWVLGIHIAEPGCRVMEISPRLGDLQWAKGTYPTPYGVVSVSCEKQADGGVRTEVSAPDEIEVRMKPQKTSKQ